MAVVVRASELLATAKLTARLEKRKCQMYRVPMSPVDGSNQRDVRCVCHVIVRVHLNPPSLPHWHGACYNIRRMHHLPSLVS
jgi:hypothetical protein